jgi:phosphatidylglycerophosphatase B
MLSKTGLQNSIDSLYALDKPARRDFFAHLIRSNPGSFLQIDEDIQEHWIEEAGFSFPSGHSFNAFLFAMILAYAIKYNRSYPHLRILFFIPFLWAFLVAVSRVAVGAHSALDVSAGALLGICIGFVFFIYRTHTALVDPQKLNYEYFIRSSRRGYGACYPQQSGNRLFVKTRA